MAVTVEGTSLDHIRQQLGFYREHDIAIKFNSVVRGDIHPVTGGRVTTGDEVRVFNDVEALITHVSDLLKKRKAEVEAELGPAMQAAPSPRPIAGGY
jgi:hypothetical protein